MLSKQTGLSYVFTLRLSRCEDNEGDFQWRGKLQHINNGEVRYFHEWASLIPLLLSMLNNHETLLEQLEDKESE